MKTRQTSQLLKELIFLKTTTTKQPPAISNYLIVIREAEEMISVSYFGVV